VCTVLTVQIDPGKTREPLDSFFIFYGGRIIIFMIVKNDPGDRLVVLN